MAGLAEDIEIEETLFFRLAGRISMLPDTALDPSLAFSRREVREKYIATLTSSPHDTADAELPASWDFFEAGISQSLLSVNPKPEDWIRIGGRYFAAKDVPFSTPKAKDEQPENFEHPQEADIPVTQRESIEVSSLEVEETKPKIPNGKQELLFDF